MGEVVVGPLARPILDRYRAPGWALLVRILERVQEESPPTAGVLPSVVAEGAIFSERTLARQTIGVDGWVTIGVVLRADGGAFLDVNLRTGDARVVVPPPDWAIGQPWSGVLVPATTFQELAPQPPSVEGEVSGWVDRRRKLLAVETDQPARLRGGHEPSRTSWEERMTRLSAALDCSDSICRQTQGLLDDATVVLDLARHPHKPRVLFARRLRPDPGGALAQPE